MFIGGNLLPLKEKMSFAIEKELYNIFTYKN
jgi:hypothetical protein